MMRMTSAATCARKASLATWVRKSLWLMYSGVILAANFSRKIFRASASFCEFLR